VEDCFRLIVGRVPRHDIPGADPRRGFPKEIVSRYPCRRLDSVRRGRKVIPARSTNLTLHVRLSAEVRHKRLIRIRFTPPETVVEVRGKQPAVALFLKRS
jgi:hypothetical protein